MTAKNVLYISGSFGLGHVARDLAIAGALRRIDPSIRLSWLAADPATRVLEEAGENLLPEAQQYAVDSVPAEDAAKGVNLTLT